MIPQNKSHVFTPFVTESCSLSQKFGYICNYLYLCSVQLIKNKNIDKYEN